MHGYGPRLGLLFLALLPGCLTTAPPPAASCAGCHGSETSAAPPEGLGGLTSTAEMGVGAHQAHLGTASFAAIACSECHVVPTSVDAPGHIDSAWPAEVVWGEVAKTDGAARRFDHAAATCTTWCHTSGATLEEHAPPVWTTVDGSQDACGTCHGDPEAAVPGLPLDHRAEYTACGACHSAEDPVEGESVHSDGIVQFSGHQGCGGGCHGDGENAAPASGAHEAHGSGGIGAPVRCLTCHIVPATGAEPTHKDASPAEVVFDGVATAAGAEPAFDNDGLTCSGSYCHGGSGATNPTPSWNGVDQATCGSCHGLPPPDPHPQDANCQGCHGNVDAEGQIVNPFLHVNGVVDF